MRVLYFSDNTSVHNRRFLEKLSAACHQVHFLDFCSNQIPQNWLPSGVSWLQAKRTFARDSNPGQYRQYVSEFKQWLSRVQPDLVHAGPVQSAAYVAALSEFHPLLVTSWGSDILLHSQRNAEWREATQVALRGADAFFCDCDVVRNTARSFAGIPDSRIVQFPWGIQRERFSPYGPLPSAEKLQLDPETIPFISTRSWEPLYGIDDILEAFLVAHQNDRRLRLFLLGGGSQAGAIYDFIAQHRLGEVVSTPGMVAPEELPRWFRAAKGYISCTRSDGSSVSLLEAMATGLPVVVSDLAANREWVSDGENGWLVPAGARQQLADRLLRVAALSPGERSAISRRNQEIVAERADWDKNFDRLLDLYERLVSVSTKAAG